MKPAPPCSLALLALFVATPAMAEPDDAPRQLAYLGVGVPVPLELQGYDPDLEGSGFEVDLLIHGRAWYAAAFFGWPHLFVGLRAGFSGLRAADGSLEIEGYLISFGPEALVRIPFGVAPAPGWGGRRRHRADFRVRRLRDRRAPERTDQGVRPAGPSVDRSARRILVPSGVGRWDRARLRSAWRPDLLQRSPRQQHDPVFHPRTDGSVLDGRARTENTPELV